MSSNDNNNTAPLKTVDPDALKRMKEYTEGKYKQTMENFKRNTGKDHSLAGAGRAAEEEEFRKPEAADAEAKGEAKE